LTFGLSRGRFHQTVFAQPKFTSAQLSVKNLPFNFTSILPQTARLNLPNTN
jgi:hypothetical protein